MKTPNQAVPTEPRLLHRIMGGFIGNVVEWYDFALYGYLAGVIAPVFFPADNPTAALIATYGIFAAGFLMRPLGAAVFGWFGDRHGRARTMQISVAMMAIPTMLLGLLPSYAQVGLLAPALLVVVRLAAGALRGRRVLLLSDLPRRDGARGQARAHGKLGQHRVDDGVAAGGRRSSTRHQHVRRRDAVRLGVASSLLGGRASWRCCDPDPARPAQLRTLRCPPRRSRCHLAAAAGVHHQPPRDPSGGRFRLRLRRVLLSRVRLPTRMAVRAGADEPRHSIDDQRRDDGPGDSCDAAAGDRRRPLACRDGPGSRCRSSPSPSVLGHSMRGWRPRAVRTASVVATHAITFALLSVPLGSAPALFVEMFPQSDRLSGYSVAFNVGLGVFGGLTPMVATSPDRRHRAGDSPSALHGRRRSRRGARAEAHAGSQP